MQDSWRPCGDRGLLLLASAASVQQRNTATYAHHGRGGQVSTYVPGCTIDRDQDRADSLHPDGLMRAACPLRAPTPESQAVCSGHPPARANNP